MSPTALCDARYVAFEGELAEAEPAQRELSHIGARTAAQVAAVTQPNLVLRLLVFLRDLGGRGHNSSSLTPGALPPGFSSYLRAGTAYPRTAAAFALPGRSSRRSPRTRSCRVPCRPSCNRSPGTSADRAGPACSCLAHRSPWVTRP